MSLSWKPVRKGKTFCAPACGARCTHKDYLDAKAQGEQVKKMLKSKGWKVHVWENCNWYVCLRKGTMTLNWSRCDWRDNGKLTDFWTLMSVDGTYPGTGSPELHTKRRFNDPNSAVAHQLNIARSYMRKINMAYKRTAA